MSLLPNPESLRIDVGGLAKHTVASLYSHLVTRPTGRAVRLAIESLLAEAGEPSVSVVDFSQVTILDFSCADEVVARLLSQYMGDDRPREAFFVLRGVQEWHEEPIQVVLERQSLAAVAHAPDGHVRLLGTVAPEEAQAWERLESLREVTPGDPGDVPGSDEERRLLDRLVERRLAFREPGGSFQSLTSFLDPA